MPRYIIGLDHHGWQFMNDVVQYCQATGHPNDPRLHQQIYKECMSQLFARLTSDFQGYMLNLMELPEWRLIHFLDCPVDYSRVAPFRDAVRAMGIAIWHRLNSRGNLDPNLFYMLDSCTETVAIVVAYVDSSEL